MKFRSLQFKLMGLVLAIAVISNIAVALIARHIASDTVQNTVHGTLDSVTNNVASTIQAEVDKQFRMLDAIALADFVRDEDISFYEKCVRMRNFVDVGSEYENISFYSKDGNSVTANGRVINIWDFVKGDDERTFQTAMNGGRAVTVPQFNEITKEVFQMYNVPVKNEFGSTVGVITANTYGNTMSDAISAIDIPKGSEIAVVDRNTGIVVASTIQDIVKPGDPFVQGELPSAFQSIIDAMLKGNSGGGEFVDPMSKIKRTSAYRPIGDTGWSVIYMCPYNIFFGGLKTMIRAMMSALCVVLLIALAASFLAAAVTVRPLLSLKMAIADIATGEADLTRRIATDSKDEIGDVVNGFNAFTGKLHDIMAQLKHSKDNLGTVGDDLAASTQDTSASIGQILVNIESVHTQVENQSRSVNETAGAVNEIASNIESLEEMIEKQSSGVTEASAAVEEMIGNIQSVNSSVEKMSDSFEALWQSAQSGTTIQADVNKRVEEIKEMSETLQEANKAISSIASQTNLLAMNAAIEAAHAGDAGAGFAVVSDEIRKLSETSAAQTKTIGEQLKNIKNAIASVVSASEKSTGAFRTVSDKIQETDEIVRQIKAAMEEQNEGSKQISTALQSMNDSTMEVHNAGKEMAEGNKAILSEVKILQDATGEIQSSMNEMSAGARKISETGEALKGIALQVKQSIDDIGGQVDRFRV